MEKIKKLFKRGPKVAVVNLSGVIAASGRGRLNDRGYANVIERAFKRGKPKAVVFLINSPGGSPVQSSLIAKRIARLSKETDIPTFAFVEDVAASGGYWLACAASEIYADTCSIVGSIGVVSSGFGFQNLIAKHGVERRVHTAGESKSTLDPFQPEKPEDIARLETILAELHEAFKAHVSTARAGKIADQDLFTGEFWTGQKALELGLIDGIGDFTSVMKERFGDKIEFVHYGVKKSFFQKFGMQMVNDVAGEIEERAVFARFGL
ncbi:MAG: S49 family peptidase [Halocynthiibacter sp.]